MNELTGAICTRLVDELGVAWDWQYGQLIAYKAIHGYCNVPAEWPANQKLATWCNDQRSDHNRNKLSQDRTARLEFIGFVWDRLAAAWEQMFNALRTYSRTYGNCDVPAEWKDNPELGRWCTRQRKMWGNKKLSTERLRRLEGLGFVWEPFNIAWEQMFAQLVAYKQTNGDCYVPFEWKDNPKL